MNRHTLQKKKRRNEYTFLSFIDMNRRVLQVIHARRITNAQGVKMKAHNLISPPPPHARIQAITIIKKPDSWV